MPQTKKYDELDSSYVEYDIYDELILCSNRLLNTNYMFRSSDNWSPIVVRKSNQDGNMPSVWLSTRIESEGDYRYVELVKNNEQVFFGNNFEFEVTENGFYIAIDSTVICEAGDVQDNSIEIFKLDLRPLGLNIYGEHNKLTIGGNQMSRNTVSKSDSMFGI
ncbi:hypothetical protein L8S00_08600 [Vibrio splendidus]|uniref:hypothetical protein n=1 Tax=Vibrio splendidus TaxID=29497 RepID=UPI0024682BD4|nr:hypothetical protein [Vibrio splendidus]MDH5903457.1 hypothetical protein [Vibrio splendidus]